MEDRKKGRPIHRRDFVVGSASVATLAGLGVGCSDDSGNGPDPDAPPVADGGADSARDLPREASAACDEKPQPLAPVSGPARVVEVHDEKSVASGSYDAARVKAMVLAGLQTLADVTDTKQAWQKLLPDFSASMRIGIKVNCLNPNLYNATEVLKALIESLTKDLGADSGKIWVWDRRTDELTRSKLTQSALGVQVAGTVASTSDASGPGYESQAECAIDRETHLSRILTAETDVTINIALLKTHNISGITGALKNVYGCVDNPGDFHSEFNTYAPALYRLDAMRKPFRLHITEGLKAVTKGDTTDYPDAMPGRLLFATDPVALDAHALELVNTLRTQNPKVPALPADKVKWLDEAARLNLGTMTTDAKLVTMP
jgi:uncharacterized protein (DUF362 family)